MPTLPPTHRAFGLSAREREQQYERDRGSAKQRLYSHAWAKASKAHICENPYCAYCQLGGRVTAAELVDHLYPHRGNVVLFWRREFWVSSCAECHNGMKQSVERQGLAAIHALAARLGRPMLTTPAGGV